MRDGTHRAFFDNWTLIILAIGAAALTLILSITPAEAHDWNVCDPGRASNWVIRGGGNVADPTGLHFVTKIKATFEPPSAFREPGSANNSHIRLDTGTNRIKWGFSNDSGGTNRIWAQVEQAGVFTNYFYGTYTDPLPGAFEIIATNVSPDVWQFKLYLNGPLYATIQRTNFGAPIAGIMSVETANTGDQFPEHISVNHWEQQLGYFASPTFTGGSWVPINPNGVGSGFYQYNQAIGDMLVGLQSSNELNVGEQDC